MTEVVDMQDDLDEDGPTLDRAGVTGEALLTAVFAGGDGCEVEPYDDATIESDAPERLVVRFGVGQVPMQSSEAFPYGSILAQHELDADGEDLFREELAVRFDEIVHSHVVFVTGSHTSGAYTDDDYAASFAGQIVVVPAANADAEEEAATAKVDLVAAHSIADQLTKLERRMMSLSDTAFRTSNLVEAATRISRVLARRL